VLPSASVGGFGNKRSFKNGKCGVVRGCAD